MLICEFDVRPRVDPRFADYALSWISLLNKPTGYLLGSYRIATAPSRTPAGSRASSRHTSIAPRTTPARGPLGGAAPRTRTHRSSPAPPMPAGASRLP